MWIRLSQIAEPVSTAEPLVNVLILDKNSRSQQIEKVLERFDGLIAKHQQDLEYYGCLDELMAHRFFMKGSLCLVYNQPISGLRAWFNMLRFKPIHFPVGKTIIGIASIAHPPLYHNLVIKKKYGAKLFLAWYRSIKQRLVR